jgi:hypothetical protein
MQTLATPTAFRTALFAPFTVTSTGDLAKILPSRICHMFRDCAKWDCMAFISIPSWVHVA